MNYEFSFPPKPGQRVRLFNDIQEYDVVALTDEVEAVHQETHQLILLKRGQVGTVLMSFNGKAYLVDFADSNGKTYAMETIPPNKLMTLIYEPTLAHA